MLILFLKAAPADPDRDDEGGDEALQKIRAGFVAAVKEAKTKEDRERAEEQLRKLDAGVA
jgi:hypothetical protein